MPGTYTFPGVYIEEIPSGVRTIAGVSTSDTAFVGFFARGPMNRPARITSFSDFQRRFGGLDSRSDTSYAIQQYYLNGGQAGWVVRVAAGAPAPATLTLQNGATDVLELAAANEGMWGENVEVSVEAITGQPTLFNLLVREVATISGRQQIVNSEVFRNLSMEDNSPRFVQAVVNNESNLIQVVDVLDTDVPDPIAFTALDGTPNDGTPPDDTALIAGIKTLDTIAPFIFNILCLPDAANLNDGQAQAVYSAANTFCEAKRAFLIVDIPAVIDSPEDMVTTWLANVGDNIRHRNSAVYFPRLLIPDALNGSRPRNVAASGTLAGVYARTDASRGIWKAPAGTEATLRGATLATSLTDLQNGDLNQLGVNNLRTFPIFGNVSWGGRTLEGADQQASEWKYIPVRRTALYIEESLFQGLKWVVFEPNDEPLWAQIRLNVGAFMNNLFRQGAFQGKTPREAYFVKCDKDTTTQNDIDRGIVNIAVGFAPLKPAEFVVIQIQQMAGQLEV